MMARNLLFTAFLFSISSTAMADPVSCYESASNALTPTAKVELCSGAENMEPINCFDSVPPSLSRAITYKIHICMGVKSKEEAESNFTCAKNARSLNLTSKGILRLCNQSYMEATFK